MSLSDFHKSTAKEFHAIRDRVRNLVNHWPEDGRYKENIFISVLKKVLPSSYNIGSGFVVKRKPFSSDEHESSKQIDVIIYDSTSPILFKQDDFVIVTPEAVEGIIEVKTNLENSSPHEVINKMHDQGEFIVKGRKDRGHKLLFNGIFSYEGYDSIDKDKIIDIYNAGSKDITLSTHKYFQFSCVNHIAFNDNWLLKYWEEQYHENKDPYYIYNHEELAYAYFISSLLRQLSLEKVDHENEIWFPSSDTIKSVGNFKLDISA